MFRSLQDPVTISKSFLLELLAADHLMKSFRTRFCSAAAFVTLTVVCSSIGFAQQAEYRTKQIEGVEKIRLLPPSEKNPRNSEGDFIELKDGRIMFLYTHFTGGGGDDDAAYLAARFSTDGGAKWTDKDVTVIEREGDFNVMSVSLLRLQDGNIALFYLRKNSLADCRPLMRISTDEGKTWSEPKLCIEDQGYFVLNNDRAVQLKSGRIVLPVALHGSPQQKKFVEQGVTSCYWSDDNGKTWHHSQKVPQDSAVTFQEPGVVELKDGRLLMYCRTSGGSQYFSYSSDSGETWSEYKPSKLISPLSPATIERIPKTGDLLAVYNNHERVAPENRRKRTPLNTAISRDDGETWEQIKTLEDDPNGWYCYTAMSFVGDHVLLGHCAGDRRQGGLNTTQITRIPVEWLYQPAAE
jgi:sialidase-1